VNAPARFFGTTAAIAYGGPEVPIPPAFRWYDKDRIVRGRVPQTVRSPPDRPWS